jgi:outer membrane protein
VFVACLLALSGCSGILGDENVPKSSRTPWVPPANEVAAKRKQLGAPGPQGPAVIFPDTPLDLPTLMDIAFENNPTTKKSWQITKIAAAQSGLATSPFFPQVKVSGVAERVETAAQTPDKKTRSSSIYPAIEMQYSVFKFGGHMKAAKAAKQMLCAANYQHNRTLQTVAHDVQRCYFTMDSAEGAVEASQRNLDDAMTAYDCAFVKNQTGLSNIQDYLRAKANRSKAEFDLENAKAGVESARASLANALGIPVSADMEIARTDDGNIRDFDIDIGQLVADTLVMRGDVLAQHSVVQARKEAVFAKGTDLLPTLVVGGSAQRKSFKDFPGHSDGFALRVALEWSVFSGFSSVYETVEARAQLRKAECELEQLKLAVTTEVWARYHAFKSAIKQLHAARNYEQSAQESFDAMVISYKNGLSSFGDLMVAQTSLASARQQTVAAKNNLSMAVVDLAYAVGVENFGFDKNGGSPSI